MIPRNNDGYNSYLWQKATALSRSETADCQRLPRSGIQHHIRQPLFPQRSGTPLHSHDQQRRDCIYQKNLDGLASAFLLFYGNKKHSQNGTGKSWKSWLLSVPFWLCLSFLSGANTVEAGNPGIPRSINMGIRVRLCSDWCLREADILSDYPQTSVSCIVRTQYPYFAQRYARITGFGPVVICALKFLNGYDSKEHSECQHQQANKVIRRDAEFHVVFQLGSGQADSQIGSRYQRAYHESQVLTDQHGQRGI